MLYAEGMITEVTPTDRSNGVNPVQFRNTVVLDATVAVAAGLTRNSVTSMTESAAQTIYNNLMDNRLASCENDERIRPSKETLPA